MKQYVYNIQGSDLQMLEVSLNPGQGLCAEAGSMVYMENEITMNTGTAGGLFAGFKRMLGGGGFFLTVFSNIALIKESKLVLEHHILEK